MPSTDHSEYNPFIIGFVNEMGPVFIPLQKARDLYGRLPSDFKLVTPKDGRLEKKGLNLSVGKAITEKLKATPVSLKGVVFSFFQNWHRDYRREFAIDMEPLLALNPQRKIVAVFKANRNPLESLDELKLRDYLRRHALIRKDVLNSIPRSLLQAKSEQIIEKRLESLSRSNDIDRLKESLNKIRASGIIRQLEKTSGLDFKSQKPREIEVYSDEISKALAAISHYLPISGLSALEIVSGKGVEFEYASRDLSYLMLGKKTGDCTADKSPFQADRDIENIYWTVFPWILDRNYQILKVYFQGNFVMKVHLMPLYIVQDGGGYMILAVDAIETVRSFRNDLTDQCKDDLLEHREYIFTHVIDKIRAIGKTMGVTHIYAEKFSNTPWVRDCFDKFPEIFLHVNQVIKLDELEDVFSLARDLCREMDQPLPDELFMEIQMKNTSLLPRVSKKSEGVKSFAILEGCAEDGIPMKKVIGI